MYIVKEIYYFFCKYIFIYLPDTFFFQLMTFMSYIRLGFKWYWLDLKNPKTFNEKINYLKLHNRNKLEPIVGDKVSVRYYVREKIGEHYLIPLIGVYNNTNEIVYDALPEKFALK